MPTYFIGIDVSTTASKAIAIDDIGTVVAAASSPHPISTPKPLWSEQNPEDWWRATCAALADVLQTIPAAEVAAVGLTGQMHGLTTLDAENRPVRPAILWNDQRSSAQCEAITAKVGAERLYDIIGTILLPGFTAPKIMWIREHEPENYSRIRHVLLPKDYVRFRLSGAYVADVADGSGMSLMSIRDRAWSPEMLDAFEIPAEWLPELCESQAVSAHVSDAAAAETGLRAGTPIVGGAGDQPAGGVGSGIVVADRVSLTVGTSGVAYAANATYAPEPNGRLHTFCGPVPDTWFHMGVMLSAAGSFRWFHETLMADHSYDDLNTLIAAVPRGANGLLFAPYLTGERNPHPDPFARGAFVGLTVRHDAGAMARAVMEGVSFGMRDQVELLRVQGVSPSAAVISGGAAKSRVWLQLIADVMGMPLYTVNSTEGAAFGAAILAAVGAEAYPDVPTATDAMIRRVKQIDPDPVGVAQYNELYSAFQAIYPALKTTFHTLHKFEAGKAHDL